MLQRQMQILIRLAQVDGILSKDEVGLIQKIARYKGLSSSELHELFSYGSDISPLDLAHMNDDERFDYLYTIVQLMKIDGRLYKEEIHFCRSAAQALGYDDGILYHFLIEVDIDDTPPKASLI